MTTKNNLKRTPVASSGAKTGVSEKKKREQLLARKKQLRVCSHSGCTVKLSMYNTTDLCSYHERQAPISQPGRGIL